MLVANSHGSSKPFVWVFVRAAGLAVLLFIFLPYFLPRRIAHSHPRVTWGGKVLHSLWPFTPSRMKSTEQIALAKVDAYKYYTTPEGEKVEIYPPPPKPDVEEYIAICLLAKNVHEELAEFLTHHYSHHGIRRFYIYDDNSQPALSTFTYAQHISTSTYDFIRVDNVTHSERETLQEDTMARCMKRYGHRHTWMGFLDVDEFLEMGPRAREEGVSLKSFLRKFEHQAREFPGEEDEVGAVAVNWIPHNSELAPTEAATALTTVREEARAEARTERSKWVSRGLFHGGQDTEDDDNDDNLSHREKPLPNPENATEASEGADNATDTKPFPPAGFRKTYTTCVTRNADPKEWFLMSHIKNFVRPGLGTLNNIHIVSLPKGVKRVGEWGATLPAGASGRDAAYSNDWLQLHHFGTGSREYFEWKARQGRSQGPGKWIIDESYWNRYHTNIETSQCGAELARYVP